MPIIGKMRIFFNWIRGYDFGDPERSGEYHFVRSYVRKGMVVFDVGANIGDYSHFIMNAAGSDIRIHCFEPVRSTFSKLQQRFKDNNNITLNNCGLSDKDEEVRIKIFGDTAGVNSIYERTSARDTHPELSEYSEELVKLVTLDSYFDKKQIHFIDLLKIDVEGHELKVIEGAGATLKNGKIRIIQFEYGGSFLDSGARLEEMHALLTGHGYKLFRLLPFGKVRIKKFRPRMENFKFSNWIAINEQ